MPTQRQLSFCFGSPAPEMRSKTFHPFQYSTRYPMNKNLGKPTPNMESRFNGDKYKKIHVSFEFLLKDSFCWSVNGELTLRPWSETMNVARQERRWVHGNTRKHYLVLKIAEANLLTANVNKSRKIWDKLRCGQWDVPFFNLKQSVIYLLNALYYRLFGERQPQRKSNGPSRKISIGWPRIKTTARTWVRWTGPVRLRARRDGGKNNRETLHRSTSDGKREEPRRRKPKKPTKAPRNRRSNKIWITRPHITKRHRHPRTARWTYCKNQTFGKILTGQATLGTTIGFQTLAFIHGRSLCWQFGSRLLCRCNTHSPIAFKAVPIPQQQNMVHGSNVSEFLFTAAYRDHSQNWI